MGRSPGSTEVIIIGGGISGTAAAYELARQGASVTLLERGELASMASGWTLAGVRQSGRHPAELPLARAAVARWATLAEELDAETDYRQDGNLRLARTPEEVPVIERIVGEQRAAGLDLTYLPDNQAVREIAPALSENVLAASFCPSDGHADPTKTVHALARAAERHGAKIRTGTTVTRVASMGGRIMGVETADGGIVADTVVVAAGVYSHWLCRGLRPGLPIRIGQVAVVQTTPLPPLLKQVLGVAGADFAGRQQVDGRLRFTGGGSTWPHQLEDLAGGNDAVQPRGGEIAGLLQRAAQVLPVVADAPIAKVWGGLLDMTPDALPIIERSAEIDGLIVAAGFSGHGFCLGPVTGQIIRELVLTGSSTFPIEPFASARFAQADSAEAEAPTLHG